MKKLLAILLTILILNIIVFIPIVVGKNFNMNVHHANLFISWLVGILKCLGYISIIVVGYVVVELIYVISRIIVNKLFKSNG